MLNSRSNIIILNVSTRGHNCGILISQANSNIVKYTFFHPVA